MRLPHELQLNAERCRVVLHGELDLDTRDQLHAALQRALGLSPGLVEVDLRDVTSNPRPRKRVLR